MRSLPEIAFRLRQEAANLWLAAVPPAFSGPRPGPLALPPPAAVAQVIAGTRYAETLHRDARRIAAGQLPVFGEWLETDGKIAWRRDYRHGQEGEPRYFRRIPYLDFAAAGDHKWIWEINRHQHLVTVAQSWALAPDAALARTLNEQLESWLQQNPPLRGINWTSALEVAFRALSWIWIWHLAAPALTPGLQTRFLNALYLHGLYLEFNLSIYFSPNTHLLGEALALEALGRLFPGFPAAARWLETGRRQMEIALRRQVLADGAYFELSSAYHVYALDMFLLHRVLAGPGEPEEMAIVDRMADFLATLLGDTGRIPLLGDDDGGRLFSPFGARDEFGRGTLAVHGVLAGIRLDTPWLDREAAAAVAAWWLGERVIPWLTSPPRPRPSASRLFPSAGLAVFAAKGVTALADAGPFGPGSAGHTHADSLQILVRRQSRPLLVDSGTFTYVSDPMLRDRFRGTAAHSTLTVNGWDQARPDGAFRWKEPPAVRVLDWESTEEQDWLDAECRYRGVRHRRAILFDKREPQLLVADRVELDSPGPAALAQYWQLAECPERVDKATVFCAGARLTLQSAAELTIEKVEHSFAFGSRIPGWAAVVRWPGSRAEEANNRVAVIDWDSGTGPCEIAASWQEDSVVIQTGPANGQQHRSWTVKLSRKA